MEIMKHVCTEMGHCSGPQHMPLQSQELGLVISNDLQTDSSLEVCRPITELKRLISDLQGMAENETLRGTEFRDEELLFLMFDNMVEENHLRRVMEVETSVPQFIISGTVGCSISDERQKSWVLNGEPPELQAVALQGSNALKKVQLDLSTYKSATLLENSGQPTVLRIAGDDLYLSCSDVSGKPTLRLEKVSDAQTLKTIKADNMRFLFYKKSSGVSMSSFESVQNPGWFISTATAEKKRVEVCRLPAQDRLTYFTVKQTE